MVRASQWAAFRGDDAQFRRDWSLLDLGQAPFDFAVIVAIKARSEHPRSSAGKIRSSEIAKGNEAGKFPREGGGVDSDESPIGVVRLEIDSISQRLGQAGHFLPCL